jgi:hypothetical protein
MEMTTQPQFVSKVVAVGTQSQKRRELLNPTWEQVGDVLRELAAEAFVRIELFNEDESCAMTIYGEAHAFFIAISVEESTYHYFWNGREPGDGEREIAGHLFDSEKVCEDFEIVTKIAEKFWRTGGRLDSVKWLSETLES